MILSYRQAAANGLVAILVIGALDAQEVPKSAPPACAPTKFIGEVDKGQVFEKEFGPGLVFRLQPSTHAENPQGWTIEVRSKQHPGHDYGMVATPPYRSTNPRYLDTSYRTTAKQAVELSPRSFRFVLTEGDYEAVHEALEYLLWPGNYSRAQVEAAEKTWKEILASRTMEGRLTILDSRLGSSGPDDKTGWIERLKFEAELCLPGGAVDQEN